MRQSDDFRAAYVSVVVMSTALDAGVPGSNLFRGCCFFLHILLGPKGTGGIISAYCKFGGFARFYFRETSHMQNFVKIKLS